MIEVNVSCTNASSGHVLRVAPSLSLSAYSLANEQNSIMKTQENGLLHCVLKLTISKWCVTNWKGFPVIVQTKLLHDEVLLFCSSYRRKESERA